MPDGLPQTRHIGTYLDPDALRGATVIQGGAGTLGNEVFKHLVLLAVGHIILVDFDDVADHNLCRAPLLTVGRIHPETRGVPEKVHRLARLGRLMNPDVTISAYLGAIEDLGVGLFRGVDLAFSCFDNRVARFSLNRLCAEADVPLVDAGLQVGYSNSCKGQVQLIRASSGGCYACTLAPAMRATLAKLADRAAPCSDIDLSIIEAGGAPTSVLMSSIIGGLQAHEGAKILSARRDVYRPGESMLIDCDLTDSRHPALRRVSVPRALGCAFHDKPEDMAPAVRLEGRSDQLSLGALRTRAASHFGVDAIDLELPDELWRNYVCHQHPERPLEWGSRANQIRAWLVIERQRIRAQPLRLPAALRSACGGAGCVAGLPRQMSAETDFDNSHIYYAGLPDCPKTPRALGFPYGFEYKVWDVVGQRALGAVTLAGDYTLFGLEQ